MIRTRGFSTSIGVSSGIELGENRGQHGYFTMKDQQVESGKILESYLLFLASRKDRKQSPVEQEAPVVSSKESEQFDSMVQDRQH